MRRAARNRGLRGLRGFRGVECHQITETDRLGLYKKPGWHGLGEVIQEGLTGEEAVKRYLPWEVKVVETSAKVDDKASVPPTKSTVRSDTGKVLGVVGPSYQVIQNIELGRFADALMGAEAAVTMETCGSLMGGRKVFLLVRVPRAVRVGRRGGDITLPYLLLVNAHDGSMAMTVRWTMIRVVCNNTFTLAISGKFGFGSVFSIRHTGDTAWRCCLDRARHVLKIAESGLARYEQWAHELAATRHEPPVIRDYFKSVFRAQFGKKPGNAEEADAWKQRRREVIGAWTALLDAKTNRIDDIGGTMWAAFNAVTEWTDQTRALKVSIGEGRRDHFRILGRGDKAKHDAMRLALAFCRGNARNALRSVRTRSPWKRLGMESAPATVAAPGEKPALMPDNAEVSLSP
jgi:phage/plasmid-like protein (TIGR03299 family)